MYERFYTVKKLRICLLTTRSFHINITLWVDCESTKVYFFNLLYVKLAVKYSIHVPMHS